MQASYSNRSDHLQVDTNYMPTLQIHAVTGSDVCVENVIDYITRNDAMLSDMKEGLEGFYSICCDIYINCNFTEWWLIRIICNY